jgi:hypothetical protein
MAFSTSSRMAAIGVTYPKTYRLTWAVFWYYKQWRADGVLDQILDTLHSKVRQIAQKNRSGQP